MRYKFRLGEPIVKVIALLACFAGLLFAVPDATIAQDMETQQKPALADALEANMKARQQGNPTPFSSQELAKEHGSALLPSLRPYFDSDSREVRQEAAYALGWVLTYESGTQQGAAVVEEMITQYRRANGKLTFRDFACVEGMGYQDFSAKAKQDLLDELVAQMQRWREGGELKSELILTVGRANIQEALPKLQEILDQVEPKSSPGERLCASFYDEIGWAALCARARMGQKEDIRRCIDLVNAEKDGDTASLLLFRDLVYVCQPEVVEEIRPLLDLDVVDPVEPGSDYYHVSPASMAAEALSAMIEGFPRHDSYESEQIAECKAWLAQQKEFKMKR